MAKKMAEDIELGAIACRDVQQDDDEFALPDLVEEKVETSFGPLSVEIVGDRKRPAILTYHDIGLNANSQFQGFFGFSDMAAVAEKFCVYHVNAPGQEDDAAAIYAPIDAVFPTMDELAEQLVAVVDHFKIKSFIGVGVGAGANVLVRFALAHPKNVEALVLVNATPWQAGWVEWAYQKANVYYLRSRGMTNITVDYLMWHHFGRRLDQCSPDLVGSYKTYFARMPQPANLAAFIQSYIWRTELEIGREDTGKTTVECPVLQVLGYESPHVADTIELNSRLDPSSSNWMKISDASGLVLEDAPDKVTEAIILFIQGLGYFPTFSHAKWRQSRQNSIVSAGSGEKSPQSPRVAVVAEVEGELVNRAKKEEC